LFVKEKMHYLHGNIMHFTFQQKTDEIQVVMKKKEG